MPRQQITREQADALRRQVARKLRYFAHLRDRLDQLGFTPDDPLWRAATAAYDGVHRLHVEAHYSACGKGTVGR